MLYNICYWWVFLSQGSQWTKYHAHLKIKRPKPCLLMFASLVALDGFHLLLSTRLSADLIPEWSGGGSMFHSLSHIYTKTPFCCVETVAKNALNHQHVFEQMQHPISAQLSPWQMFMQNGEYTAFWYLQLLCYLTQLQFMISQNKFVEFFFFFFFFFFFVCVFSWTTTKFGQPEHSASFVSVQPHLRLAYHLLAIVSDRAESE